MRSIIAALVSLAALAALALVMSVTIEPPVEVIPLSDAERRIVLAMSPLPPPPPDETNRVADDPAAAELGHRLFFEERLSPDSRFSCATCHSPELGFADGLTRSEGRQRLQRHAPSLWNVAYSRWLFWDGREDTLWGQAMGPLEHPDEIASNRLHVARLIDADPGLRAGYEDVFGALPPLAENAPRGARPGPPDDDLARAWSELPPDLKHELTRVVTNVGKALAAYQRQLLSRRSPFDVFVEGLRARDPRRLAALPAQARRGLHLFIGRANCRSCHSGPELSDLEFHDTRVPPLEPGPPDPGRYGGFEKLQRSPFTSAGEWSDSPQGARAAQLRRAVRTPHSWGQFKTPTLRNVALSPPYMHEGQLPDLEAVVRYYSTLEGARPLRHHEETVLVPLGLTEEEQADLVAFLHALTDDAINPEWLEPPS